MAKTYVTERKTRVLTLPANFEAALARELSALGYSFDKPKDLAQAVLRLSNHYLENPTARTPWLEPWAQAASLAYFFPLNLARNLSVAAEAKRLGFFEGLDELVDFGSGTGSGVFAFMPHVQKRVIAIDVSRDALDLAGRLAKDAGLKEPEKVVGRASDVDPSRALLLSSYALTELPEMPREWLKYEGLAILEPSTRDDGRSLMRLRQELIDNGYSIWAPCTHQGACPLLTHSEKDWCHDRIHWQAPEWMLAMEKTLPMKNRTLTFSYLLARKTLKAPAREGYGRLVGDELDEKGKTRQAYCRGEEREFLAWFPQRMEKTKPLHLERGNLVRADERALLKKSSELRVASVETIYELAPGEPVGD